MPFIVSEGSSFTPCPAGPHSAVAVDVIDLGMVTSTFEGKPKTAHKCRIVWQVAERKEDGTPYQVSKQYTAWRRGAACRSRRKRPPGSTWRT
jgi:hypothetical protein